MKKSFNRLVALILCIIMAAGILPITSSISANAYTIGNDYPYFTGSSSPYLFYAAQCTDFVAWCLNTRNGVAFNAGYGGKIWGNAREWKSVAESLGYTVDHNPAVGAVAYWGNTSSSGHVAWVRIVNPDGSVLIEEYNHPSALNNYSYGEYNERNNVNAEYYIHIKDISEPFNVSDSGNEQSGTNPPASSDSGTETGGNTSGGTTAGGTTGTISGGLSEAEIQSIISTIVSIIKAFISFIVKIVKRFI